MPNWCYNKATLEHTDPAMITRAVEAFKKGEFLREFIPCEETANAQSIAWGTKWDVGDEDGIEMDYEPGSDTVSLVFDSAWSPPLAGYDALLELGFRITAYYYEPGNCCCGQYDDGAHEGYDTDDYDSIPEDVREELGIEPPEDEEDE